MKKTTVAKWAGLTVVLMMSACSSTPEPQNNTPAQTQASTAPTGTGGATAVDERSIEYFKNTVGDTVRFDYDASDLDADDRATLDRQAQWLARNPAVVITVEGHCDERGTREYNLALGARRAAAVKEYLTSVGVSSSRVETISYGKERPTCSESNEACWAQNRRGVSTIRSGAAS